MTTLERFYCTPTSHRYTQHTRHTPDAGNGGVIEEVAVTEQDLQPSRDQVLSLQVVEVELFGPVGERRLTGTGVLPLALREEVTVR